MYICNDTINTKTKTVEDEDEEEEEEEKEKYQDGLHTFCLIFIVSFFHYTGSLSTVVLVVFIVFK